MSMMSKQCDRTRRLLVAGLALSPVFGLWGCLGKPGIQEQYLRVLEPSEGCEKAEGAAGGAVIGVRGFKALDALDRLAVMVSEGNVMRASQSWYWEASPGRLMEQAVVSAMACSAEVTPAWPVRSTTEAAAYLSGLVTVFGVQTRGMMFVLEVKAQLMNGSGVVLGAKAFNASMPVSIMAAAPVAEAAAGALRRAAGEMTQWAVESVPKGSGAPGGRK